MTGAATTRTEQLQTRWSQALMGNYATPSVALSHGSGAVVTDVDGKDYLDLYAGIAVNVLGHAHPAVQEAVARQLAHLGHVSNLVASEPAVLLAERLKEITGHDRVLFTNSGAEANEAALKLARRHRPGGGFVACEGAFHGRTLGALSVTGQPAKREPFGPLIGPVTFVPYGDSVALAAAVTDRTASVLLEPVLGEAGVVLPPEGYLQDAREICDGAGVLLHLDEVQGGIGRAGGWLAHHVLAPGTEADVVTLAKGLGGGLPIGATLARGDAAHALQPGDHGSTFGGNPVACAAALAVLDTVERDGLLARSARLGDRLVHGLRALDHPMIDQVRGVGLWVAVVLIDPIAADVEKAARAAGFLLNVTGPNTLRLAPPLVVTEAQLDTFVTALPDLLDTPASVGPEKKEP